MTDLDEIYSGLDRQQLLSSLDPKLRGDYYQLTCPSCGKKEAYIYKDGRTIKCNRAANCGFSISLFDWVSGAYGLSSNRDVVLFLARFAGIPLRGGGKNFGESGGRGYGDGHGGGRSSEGRSGEKQGSTEEIAQPSKQADSSSAFSKTPRTKTPSTSNPTSDRAGDRASAADSQRSEHSKGEYFGEDGGGRRDGHGGEGGEAREGRGDGDNSMSARASGGGGGEGRKSGEGLAAGVAGGVNSKKQRSTTSTTASDTQSKDYDRWWLRGTFGEENEKDEKNFPEDGERPSKDGELSASAPPAGQTGAGEEDGQTETGLVGAGDFSDPDLADESLADESLIDKNLADGGLNDEVENPEKFQQRSTISSSTSNQPPSNTPSNKLGTPSQSPTAPNSKTTPSSKTSNKNSNSKASNSKTFSMKNPSSKQLNPPTAAGDSSSAHDHLIHADENLLEVALQFFQAQLFSKEGEGGKGAAPGAARGKGAAATGEGAVARGEEGRGGNQGNQGKRGDDKRSSDGKRDGDSLIGEGLFENDLNGSEYSAKNDEHSDEHSDGTSTSPHSNSTPGAPDPSSPNEIPHDLPHEARNESFQESPNEILQAPPNNPSNENFDTPSTDPTKTASFCLNYLHRRGYSKDEIKWMELGYYPSQQALRNFLQMGHSDQEIARFEKILFTKNFGVTHQLVIPFRDGRGHLVGFILRSLLDEQELARHGDRKYKYNAGLKPGSLFFNFHRAGWIGDGALGGSLGGSEPSSFNPIQKPKFPKAPDRLVVVEGYLDALVCSARGFSNVVAVGGAMPTQRQVSHAVKMGAKSFVFALDNDSDFSNVAKRVQRSLQLVHDRGARGYVVDWGKVGEMGRVGEGGSDVGGGVGGDGGQDGGGAVARDESKEDRRDDDSRSSDETKEGRRDSLSSEGLLENDLNGSAYPANSDKHGGGESDDGGDGGGGRDDKKDFNRIKDPDELIKRQGISAFVSLVENALTGQRWLATSLLQKYGLGAQGGWDQDDGRGELGGGTTGTTPVDGGPVDRGAVGDGAVGGGTSVGTEKTDFASTALNTAPIENTPPNQSIESSFLHSKGNLTDIQRDDLIERALQIGQTLVDPLANRDFFQVICRGIGITLEDLSPRIKDYRYRELKRQQRLDYGRFLTRANRMLLRGDMGQLGSYLKHELHNLNAKNVEEVLHPYTQDMARADIAKRGDGLRTGIDYLDRYFLIPKEAITVVAGRPAHGKTTLLLNIFLNMIELYPDKKFFFFSYEQSKSELYIRIINILAGHRLDQYKNLSKIEAYLRDGGGKRGGESNGWGKQGERGTHWDSRRGGTHWSDDGRDGSEQYDSRRGGDSREDGGGRGGGHGGQYGRGGQHGGTDGGTDGGGHWVIPEIERAKQKYNELVASGRLWLVEEPYHISELTDTMNFLSQKYSDVGACFIDYIQKIKTKEKYQSRQVEIQKTSAELLESAKRNHYPVIVGAQFNREVQDIGGVNMSSLRESGDIEQDASLILGLFNGAFTLAETDGEEMPSGEIDLTLKIIKNRNGLVNKSATLLWDLPVSKIKSKHDLGQ